MYKSRSTLLDSNYESDQRIDELKICTVEDFFLSRLWFADSYIFRLHWMHQLTAVLKKCLL